MKKLDRGRGPFFGLTSVFLFFLPLAVRANIQQIDGPPGSPGAARSINGQVLRLPAPPFGSEIGQVE